MRIVAPLPYAKKLNGIPVSQPIGNKKIAILCFQHIGQRDVILLVNQIDTNLGSNHVDFSRHNESFNMQQAVSIGQQLAAYFLCYQYLAIAKQIVS
jgi:hypothetical protein